MAFSEIEARRNELALQEFLAQHRPPAHIRSKLDLGYEFKGHAVELFELRPDWQDKTIIRRTPVAKVRYVKTQEEWRLYWMRADLKWHLYEPSPDHRFLKDALRVVGEDEHGCFFG